MVLLEFELETLLQIDLAWIGLAWNMLSSSLMEDVFPFPSGGQGPYSFQLDPAVGNALSFLFAPAAFLVFARRRAFKVTGEEAAPVKAITRPRLSSEPLRASA